MAVKVLHVKKVAVKDDKVSIQDEDNKWYGYFKPEDADKNPLIGEIWAGGEIKVKYDKNGRWRNVSKYKIIDGGKKLEKNKPSSNKTSSKDQEQIQKNFEAKQDSIVRQVCLKGANKLVANVISDISEKTAPKIVKIVTIVAEGYYNWLVREEKVDKPDEPAKAEVEEDDDLEIAAEDVETDGDEDDLDDINFDDED